MGYWLSGWDNPVEDIGLIRDKTNLVAWRKEGPSTLSGVALFKGPLEMTKQLDTLESSREWLGINQLGVQLL